jgi:hypothetical protein
MADIQYLYGVGLRLEGCGSRIEVVHIVPNMPEIAVGTTNRRSR